MWRSCIVPQGALAGWGDEDEAGQERGFKGKVGKTRQGESRGIEAQERKLSIIGTVGIQVVGGGTGSAHFGSWEVVFVVQVRTSNLSLQKKKVISLHLQLWSPLNLKECRKWKKFPGR